MEEAAVSEAHPRSWDLPFSKMLTKTQREHFHLATSRGAPSGASTPYPEERVQPPAWVPLQGEEQKYRNFTYLKKKLLL